MGSPHRRLFKTGVRIGYMAAPIKVFLSYSRDDKDALMQFGRFLKQLEREGLIESWRDREIEAGQMLDEEISEHLEQSKIVLLLVSQSYIVSDYCYSREMKRALELAKLGQARVIAMIVRPCDWHHTPLAEFKVVPEDGRPVSKWEDSDEAFLDAHTELRRACLSIGKSTGTAKATSPPVPGIKTGVSPLVGSNVEAPPLKFTVSADPCHIRQEGLTELIGDVFVSCKYEDSEPPAKPLSFSVTVSLSTNVTSRLSGSMFGSGDGGDPVICEVGRVGSPTFLRCERIDGNCVYFPRIELNDILPKEERVYRISNIRCNAAGIGGEYSQIQAAVDLGQPKQAVLVVATLSSGLHFEVEYASELGTGPSMVSPAAAEPERIGSLRFIEGFPNAFKTRAPVDMSIFKTWQVGRVDQSESCVLAPILQTRAGGIVSTGLADYGTRLQVEFFNIPTGMELLVSAAEMRGGMRATIVEQASTLIDSPRIIAGVDTRQLRPEDGYARAVWEVFAARRHKGSKPGWVEFAVFGFISQASHCQNTQAVTVLGSFAPAPPRAFSMGTGTQASETLPIPRFANHSTVAELVRAL